MLTRKKKKCVCCLLSCQAIVYSKACAKNTLHEGGISGRAVSVIRRLKCNLKITKDKYNTKKKHLRGCSRFNFNAEVMIKKLLFLFTFFSLQQQDAFFLMSGQKHLYLRGYTAFKTAPFNF